jgi:hypothetical protein
MSITLKNVTVPNGVSNYELGFPIKPTCYAYDPDKPVIDKYTKKITRTCIIIGGKVTGENNKVTGPLD